MFDNKLSFTVLVVGLFKAFLAIFGKTLTCKACRRQST